MQIICIVLFKAKKTFSCWKKLIWFSLRHKDIEILPFNLTTPMETNNWHRRFDISWKKRTVIRSYHKYFEKNIIAWCVDSVTLISLILFACKLNCISKWLIWNYLMYCNSFVHFSIYFLFHLECSKLFVLDLNILHYMN